MASNVTVIVSPLLTIVQSYHQLFSNTPGQGRTARRCTQSSFQYSWGMSWLQRVGITVRVGAPLFFGEKKNFWDWGALLELELESSSSPTNIENREKGLRTGCFAHAKNIKSVTYLYRIINLAQRKPVTKLESDQDMSQIIGQEKENKQYCRLHRVVLSVASNKRSASHAKDENVSAKGFLKRLGSIWIMNWWRSLSISLGCQAVPLLWVISKHTAVWEGKGVIPISILGSFLLRTQNYQASYLVCSCSSTVFMANEASYCMMWILSQSFSSFLVS